jgi:hypothetical protein
MRKYHIKRIRGGLAFGALLLAGIWFAQQREAGDNGPTSVPLADQGADAADAFLEWVSRSGGQDLPQAVAAARARAARMRELIRTDPEQAIREALTYSEWIALPEEVRAHVEEPFSVLADIEVVVVCGEAASETRVTTTFPDLAVMETYVYGRRRETGSKTGVPVQGIRLGHLGALREKSFQSLDRADETAALQRYPIAVPDPGGDSVASLAGGHLFYFRNRSALEEANARLAALEELPGPGAGAKGFYQSLEEPAAESGIDWPALEEAAYGASSEWTGTPRDMYVILVDFPDRPGQPTDPVALSNTINTTVSQQILDMSYEKTYILATVNPTTYRMPEANAAYTNHSLLYNHATEAAESDGADLSPYETICVYHPAIDGEGYAGLASVGGKKMWLKSASAKVITHELGHNYGSRHASFWAAANQDPADPSGTGSEYGDFTDIMGAGSVPSGHFNAFHKKKVRWLDEDNWLRVTNSGTYRIHRSDHRETEGLLRGLEIDKGDGGSYWVGLRQEYNSYERFGRGAYLLWKKPSDNRSYLLDMTPQSEAGKDDSGLALGQTYSDAAAGVHITPVARGGQTPDEWMDITVNLGDFPGNQPPVATLAGPTNLSVRTSVVFSVSASDADGDELSYCWDIGDGLVKANSSSLVAAWLAGSTATVSCVVSDMKGGTNRTTQTVVLSDPLDRWTQRSAGTTEDLNDVAYGAGRLVAVGNKGTTAYSDDGTNWTVHADFNIWPGNLFLEAVTYDGGQFIAAGMDYDSDVPGWEQVVFTSPDGTYWTERYDSDSGSGSNMRFNDVAAGGGVRISVGDGGMIVRSTDGTSWTTNVSGTTIDLDGVSYGDGSFVAVGAAGGGGPAVVLTSADGLSWSDYSGGVDLSAWKGFYDVQFCNDRFLASGWYARILHSTDQGRTFSTLMTGDRQIIPAFAYGNGIYFAAGINKDDSNADINLVSLDGASWMALNTTSQDNRNAAVFFDGTFITVGNNGAIWQSDAAGSLESGWAIWQLEHAAELGVDRDPLEDADHDGQLNLTEYAMGTMAADPGSVHMFDSDIDAGGYFRISFDRNGIMGDIDYLVERCSNLLSNDWSTVETVVVTNTSDNLTVRSAIPVNAQGQEFLRLKIQVK